MASSSSHTERPDAASFRDFSLDGFSFDDDGNDLGKPRELTAQPPSVNTSESLASNETHTAGRLRRHRESMARRRLDQRGRMTQLQGQEQTLHRQLRTVLEQMMTQQNKTESNPAVVEFAELVQTAESLEQEKERLEQTLYERDRYQRLVATQAQRMSANIHQWKMVESHLDDGDDDHQDPATSAQPDRSSRGPGGCWIQFLDSEPPFFYELETRESSAAAIRAGIHTVDLVHHTFSQHPEKVWTVHCLGWKAERSITFEAATSTGINITTGRPILRSRLTKRVPRHCTSLQELQHKTWQQLHSAELTSRVYSRAVSVQVVQKLDEDAVVVVRNSPARNNHKRFRHFNLNAKMTFGKESLGVLMLYLDKQPRRHQADTTSSSSPAAASSVTSWLTNGGAWFRFSHVDTDWIEIEYVGFVECFDRAHAHHLMFESCAALLRWEHWVAPPRLLAL